MPDPIVLSDCNSIKQMLLQFNSLFNTEKKRKMKRKRKRKLVLTFIYIYLVFENVIISLLRTGQHSMNDNNRCIILPNP